MLANLGPQLLIFGRTRLCGQLATRDMTDRAALPKGLADMGPGDGAVFRSSTPELHTKYVSAHADTSRQSLCALVSDFSPS